MKRKSSPPLVADDRRHRKKSGAARRKTAAGRDTAAGCSVELPLLADKPAPHLLVTEVSYTPYLHNPTRFPCAFNRRGAIVSVPLDGAVSGAARPPSAAIRRQGRLADLYRRCLSFIGATPHGRLAFAGSRGVFLVNPVTDALQGVDSEGYCQKAVVATGGDGGYSLFVSLGALLSEPTLWRLDEDGEGWSKRTVSATAEQTGDIVSAVNCKGCFYVLHEDGCVSKIDAGEPPPLLMEKLPVANLADHLSSPPCNTLPGEGHLLESDGEVFFVRKLLAVKEIATPFCDHTEFVDVVCFEVYKLDVTEQRWTKVERLASDVAVFVSPGSSAFAVRASETAAGCMSNCVYFVGEKPCCFACGAYGPSTWGVYSMERREVLFEHAVASRGGRTEALWFLPSVSA
ncbi:hypothetical protein BAE44_0015873 [Dichanthelium oligosanthes]|uniref:KIB1-4 beta-propeller domain-containing protein n=1 Tax=Dichanthelium oligosanthes TaxID=888268 RepID=A0A1E5VD83_9POAL|nr:hypothetical protein BAE44_0015873 [Dichanthelium oligosanthes]